MVCIIVLPPTFFLPREKKRKGVTVRNRVRKNNDGAVLRTFLCISAVYQKRIHTFAEPSQLQACRLQANYKNEPNQDEQEQWKVERNWQRRRNAAARTTAHSPYSAPTAT